MPKKNNHAITSLNTAMIRDSWHDEMAAQTFGIPFVDAKQIHEATYNI